MDSQGIIQTSRLVHLRELKAEIARLRAENAALREASAALDAHFNFALQAAMELKDGEPLEIWDGWNLILGAGRQATSREELIAQAQATGRRIWIVFDGHDENAKLSGKVRVSYTGGSGEHRADKYICDYLRMAKQLGLAGRLSVLTHDRDFAATVQRILG